MRLPSKKRPGQPILAKDWNLLIDALEARTPRPGPGTEIVSTSAGFTFRMKSSSSGGAGTSNRVPLTILGSRPPYIPPPATPPNPESTTRRYYVEWGTLNNLVAENWKGHFDVSSTTYFFAKATLRPTGSLLVTQWEIVTGPDDDSHQTPDWEIGANRPDSAVILLGMVTVTDGVHRISQAGGGSLVVSEHVTSIQPGSAAGDIRLGKELTYHRLTY